MNYSFLKISIPRKVEIDRLSTNESQLLILANNFSKVGILLSQILQICLWTEENTVQELFGMTKTRKLEMIKNVLQPKLYTFFYFGRNAKIYFSLISSIETEYESLVFQNIFYNLR